MNPTSQIEFLVWLLMAAAAIAILARRLDIPYTVALVAGGVLLTTIHLTILSPLQPGNRPVWLTPDVILILFLPALVFEGSIKLNIREIVPNAFPLLMLATLGVIVAALATGLVAHWFIGLPLLVACLFGAIIAATDPISVLAIFKNLSVSKRLSLILEGESLLNDGTAVVLFEILTVAIVEKTFSITQSLGHFAFEFFGGVVLGSALGYLASRLTATIDDAQIEITFTTILAYGSYLLAHHLGVSGVIATACAGMMLGNVGVKKGMSKKTRTEMYSFWEYVSFVMNSLVFLLIGLEIHVREILSNWWTLLLAVIAVLIGRIVSIYPLMALNNLFAEKIPVRWQHLFVWCGLRGALALALALSLSSDFPNREEILDLTFGVVIFSIVIQGLTVKPLVKFLKITASPF